MKSIISTAQLKTIIQAFLYEACNALGLDSDSINITYGNSQSHYVLVCSDEDAFDVSDKVLHDTIQNNCITLLRVQIYACARFIKKRREKPSWRDMCSVQCMKDAFGFGQALLILKGVSCPCPPMLVPDSFFLPALEILKDEFGLNGKVFATPRAPYYGAKFYQVHLDNSTSLELIKKYNTKNGVSSPKKVSMGEKGSLENPFDTIYDAMDWLKDAEAEAYTADGLLKDIANKIYMYDLNTGHFRISWADSHAAHLNNKYPEKAFIVNQMAPLDQNHPEIFYFSFKPNLYRRKFLYRGQSDYYKEWPCVPNLFRDKEHNDRQYYLDFLIFSQEMEVLIKSLPLVQLLEEGIEINHDKFRFRMHYTGLAQHYYNKSRYLDLTSDLDVAAFFATTSYDRNSDSYSPLKNAETTGVLYYYNLEFPQAFQQHKGYALKTIGKQLFMRSGSQSGFLLDMDKDVDFKTLPEVNAVYFKHDNGIAEELFEKSNFGKDYFGDDLLQHAWHDRFKQRYEQRVVSKEAVLLNVERNPGETIDSITKKLDALNITVDDYIPQFTDAELSLFYEKIDDWWTSFCDDIYFASSDGEWYRQGLKDICKRPEYAWAFGK